MDRVAKEGNSSLIIELHQMFFFSMECGDKGFVVADTATEAIKKLEQQQSIIVNKTVSGYNYKNEEGIFELQIWQLDKSDCDKDVFITDYW